MSLAKELVLSGPPPGLTRAFRFVEKRRRQNYGDIVKNMESFILAQGAAEYKRPWNVTVQAFRRPPAWVVLPCWND